MNAIIFNEIKNFFASIIGYLVIGVFLILNSLFLWIFEGEYNILNNGFADLSPFFELSPWILIFLIPAITMRSFSDEKKQGTLELLLTKPLSIWQIVFGKFFGAFILVMLAILPTLVYIKILSNLGLSPTDIDLGSVIGSYFGLLFLISTYTSIGIFCSTLSENQIVAFITSVFICFIFYFGFDALALVSTKYFSYIDTFSIQKHFKSISRGVIDTRDIVFFISLTILFLFFTIFNLKLEKLK